MILFIDTHTELITIALKTKDNLFIKTKESEYSHSIYTMPMIEELFKERRILHISGRLFIHWSKEGEEGVRD